MVLLERLTRASAVGTACLALAACATSPLDTSTVNSRATPTQVSETTPEQGDTRIQWGGHIVSIVNQDQVTVIEVLSYPVSRDGMPNTYKKTTGRFVVRHEGFLEPEDYEPGRLLTVVGKVDSLVTTSVEDTQFKVPLVTAEQLKLWPDRYSDRPYPRFGFGIGIGIGL
jgi:outer membrane lipoprotein